MTRLLINTTFVVVAVLVGLFVLGIALASTGRSHSDNGPAQMVSVPAWLTP